VSSIQEEVAMLTRRTAAAAALAAAIASAPAGAAVEAKQIPVVRLHAMVEVAAPPAAVWSHLTTGRNLVTWCPMWKSPGNAKVDLTRVGSTLDFTDSWGNGGRSVVTYLAKNKEIRIAHEPAKGDYMCQAKLILEPAAGGRTLVHYWDQYTDESPPEDLAATQKRMEAETESMLAALKQAVEKK